MFISNVLNLAETKNHVWETPYDTIKKFMDHQFRFSVSVTELNNISIGFLKFSELSNYILAGDIAIFVKRYNIFMMDITNQLNLKDILNEYINKPVSIEMCLEIEAKVNVIIQGFEDKYKINLKNILLNEYLRIIPEEENRIEKHCNVSGNKKYVFEYMESWLRGIPVKNKYTIVYENKSYYYCRVPGADELKRFSKDEEDVVKGFSNGNTAFWRTVDFDIKDYLNKYHKKDIERSLLSIHQHILIKENELVELKKQMGLILERKKKYFGDGEANEEQD